MMLKLRSHEKFEVKTIGHYLSLFPVFTSNMCTMPAFDTAAKYFPSGLNAAWVGEVLWVNVCT